MTIIRNGIEMRPTVVERLAVLRQVCTSLSHSLERPLRMLEIGSLLGDSAKVLAEFSSVQCIDLWDYPHGLDTFIQNVRGLPVDYFQGSSTDLLPSFPSRYFDLVYVDGDHTYPTVEFDLRQADRVVNVGGVVCGDDLEVQLASAQDIVAAEAVCEIDYIHGYHPGVSLAVHRVFGFVNEDQGFWWVTR